MAAARGVSASAFVRLTLAAILAQADGTTPSAPTLARPRQDARTVKVTLRMSAAHVVALATEARAAEVSQGAYVAGLIDGAAPAPRAPNHAEAVATLARSTDQLAALGPDLNVLRRCLAPKSGLGPDDVRADLASIVNDLRRHLVVASTLVAALRPARRPAADSARVDPGAHFR
jgi:hypothetical protein